LEGTLFAAACLSVNGYKACFVRLIATKDENHTICAFKQDGYWGAISKSKFSGLRFREPIYETISCLIKSYFEFYYNSKGEKTLRKFSRPLVVKLGKWLWNVRELEKLIAKMRRMKLKIILPSKIKLSKVSKAVFASGIQEINPFNKDSI